MHRADEPQDARPLVGTNWAFTGGRTPKRPLGQAGLRIRRRVAADDLPVLDEHGADGRHAVRTALARVTWRCRGEADHDQDGERDRECDQRGSSNTVSMPQRKTPAIQRPGAEPGYVSAKGP